MSLPFRFIAPMPSLELPPARWRDEIRRIEDLGFSTVSVSEHLANAWAMDPLTVMSAAAEVSDRLRVLSLVLLNDLRHPVVLHRAAATIDRVSNGRLELGLGAGWQAADYAALNWNMDPPGVRIERLAESVEVLRQLFGPDQVNFDGKHYQVKGVLGLPRSIQQPHPPILVGGGGRRVLQIAARSADIVGVHATLDRGVLSQDTASDFGADRIATKIGWIRAAMQDAGRAEHEVELQFSVYLCRIGMTQRSGRRTVSTFAERLAVDPELVATSPSVLIGSVSECVDLLVERRERFGFSYLRLSDDIQAVAPIIRQLAGR